MSDTEHAEKERVGRLSSSASGHKTQTTGVAMMPPVYNPAAGPIQMQEDTQGGSFGDTESAPVIIHADEQSGETGMAVNNPVFDQETMRETISTAQFVGAGDPRLSAAMITLYSEPEGAVLEEAIATIAQIRGLEYDSAMAQYERAMEVRTMGEDFSGSAEVSEGFSPEDIAEGGAHEGFTGSTGQLRFGMILGDVFNVDPVFGSLISPTGGAIGPGASSVSNIDPNNAVAMHGTVHDAAGYLLNAHGLGPGYNYLGSEWEPFDTDNPLAGQVSGINYFADGDLGTAFGDLGTAADQYLTDNFPIYGQIKGLAGDAWSGIKSAGSWALEQGQNLWEGAKGLASDAWSGAQSAGGWAMEQGQNMWEGAKGLANDAWSGAQSAGGWAMEQGQSMWEGAKGLASDAWSGAQSAGGWAMEQGQDMWDGAKGLASDAWSGAQSAGGWAMEQGQGMWEGAKGLANDAWSGAQSAGGWAMEQGQDMWEGAKSVGGSIADGARSIGGSIADGASDAWESFKGLW